MEKIEAISILEDIKESLNKNNIQRAKKDILLYKKNLEIATNKKIKKLLKIYTENVEKYGDNDKKTIKISRKIDKEINRINSRYNS